MTTSGIEVEERGMVSDGRGLVEYWRPISWSAVTGGAVAALGVQMILTLPGIGLGAAMVNPVRDADPGSGLGTGAVVWLIVSGIISFGIGGWVAGHMSGVLRTGSGLLHGAASWALAAVLGAIVTALAGATVLGGASAGMGAAAGGAADRVGMVDVVSLPGGVRATAGNDGTTRFTDSYGRSMTEAEARQAADEARKATAKASLWTGVAFLLSMVSASLAGRLGRTNPEEVLRSRRGEGRAGHPRA